MPFRDGFGETWGLKGKVASVFGNNDLARSVSDALRKESVKVVDECNPRTSILITIPSDMNQTKTTTNDERQNGLPFQNNACAETRTTGNELLTRKKFRSN